MRDLYDQSQVRFDHQSSGLPIALLNARGQLDLLLRSQKRDLSNLPQINFNPRIRIFTSHRNYTRIDVLAANLSSISVSAERLGNEKLTTLTNLNFDSPSCRNVQWFLVFPNFYRPRLLPGQAFRSQDSGGK